MKKILSLFLVLSAMILSLSSCSNGLSFERKFLLKRYYRELGVQYPQFKNIPESEFAKSIQYDKEANKIYITYWYTPRGFRSNCFITFSQSDDFPEGKWGLYGGKTINDGMRKVTDETAGRIRSYLLGAADRYMKEHQLVSTKRDSMFWLARDGELYISYEVIAEPIEPERIDDHLHIFARVKIDFTNGMTKLLPQPIYTSG